MRLTLFHPLCRDRPCVAPDFIPTATDSLAGPRGSQDRKLESPCGWCIAGAQTGHEVGKLVVGQSFMVLHLNRVAQYMLKVALPPGRIRRACSPGTYRRPIKHGLDSLAG